MNRVDYQMFSITDMPLQEGENVLIPATPGKIISLTQFQFQTNGSFSLYDTKGVSILMMNDCDGGSMSGILKLTEGVGLVMNFKSRTDSQGLVCPGLLNGMLMYF